MTVRDIRLFGDPVLKSPSSVIHVVDDSITALVQDLLDTTSLPGRAGVAAPQIGVNLRAFGYHVDGELGYVLNPVLVETWGDQVLVQEGCLSVPELWHETPRHQFARVRGIDLNGEVIELVGEGLMAQMLQHECDHLDGLLYLDRLQPAERKAAMRKLRETDWFLKN